MGEGRRRIGRVAAAAVAALVATAAIAAAGGGTAGAGTGSGMLPRAEGAGPPVKASGMGTQAALDNPRCSSGPEYGPYGRFDTAAVGQGPPCVKVWKAGDDNGGATTQGVTKDRIKVVAYLPNAEQFSKDPVPPMVRATNTKGVHVDGIHDWMVPHMHFYETWGRDIELHFFTSSGSDESAQRSDAVAIKEMKPFAAVMISSNEDKSVLESELAAAKIMTFGYNASPADSAQQSPYRWNSADNDAVAINAAEVLAKQVDGRKAQFGGDDVNGQTRKIGAVYTESLDYDGFERAFERYGGGTVEAAEIPLSPPEAFQAAAPTIITRMKSAGVTTIVPFVGSQHMTALMEAANQQEYFPEWFFTGASYQDIAILARNYPQEQAQHAFGIVFIAPWIEPAAATGEVDPGKSDAPLDWYWGLGAGTYTQRYGQALGYWLLAGVHAAGPKLTPKTFKQGLFATPGRFGAYEGRADGIMVGFGKAPKLPYDSYATAGYDFSPWWWDPDTEGASAGVGVVGKGVGQYVAGGKRYVATTWPKKPFNWFDPKGAISSFDSRPGGPLEYAGDCEGCPSTGGPGQPGAPSDQMIVFKAGGEGTSTA